MTKFEQIAERVVVTFVEAAGAYLVVIPTLNWSRAAIAGAVGAGLSAAYNYVKESTPSLVTVASPTETVVTPQVPSPSVTPTTPAGQGTTPPTPVDTSVTPS